MLNTSGSAGARGRPGSVADREQREWDLLATALNSLGVVHVGPRWTRRRGGPRTASELFDRLFRSPDPRLQQATIPLLLTYPELADEARVVIDRLEGVVRDRAMRRYVAAVALQRMARTRLEMQIGPRGLIPPAYLDELDLPELDEDFGRETLLALAEGETARYGYDAWGTYRGLLDLILSETRRRGWGVRCDDALIRPA
jgi:hypothetical protein